MSLQIFELLSQGGNPKRQRLHELLEKRHDVIKSKSELPPAPPEPPAPESQTARSSALRSEVAPSAAGVGGSGHRKLRKRYIFLGRDGRKRLDDDVMTAV